MDPDVIHDPVFQQLLMEYELESRKLRDAVIAMRSFYLTHHKRPLDETTSEKWRGAILSEEACRRHEAAVDAAAQLLRYSFEIAPHNNDGLHLEEIMARKIAHRERLDRRSGWGKSKPHPNGIEEKVHIDDGPPVTWVINPKNYEFTERARRRRERQQAAIPSDDEDVAAPE
jgi:hypothetical protein